MTLGKRRQRQTSVWGETRRLQPRGRHPFSSLRNGVVGPPTFDIYGRPICGKYCATTTGRPSIAPGACFRGCLIGYFEGIDSRRGIAYRVSYSLCLLELLGSSLEAKAALRLIVRQDSGASYDEDVIELMRTEGIEGPAPAQRQRFDRRCRKSLSNWGWVNPHYRQARITKMKDGGPRLPYKAAHAVDLETGAVEALTVQPVDRGDTASM